MKQFTDFNDLAMKSILGKDALRRQVRYFVECVIGKQVVERLDYVQQPRQKHDIQQRRVTSLS